MADYWDDRKNWNYYNRAIRLAARFAWNAEHVIEVGGGRTKMLEDITWIGDKTAIDLESKPAIKWANTIQGDFLKFELTRRYDLVLCLQALEHLPIPEVFMYKLFDAGKIVIVSVPYKWPQGFCPHHCQDPVDEEKLISWAGRDWLYHEIVEDKKMKRLIAVYL